MCGFPLLRVDTLMHKTGKSRWGGLLLAEPSRNIHMHLSWLWDLMVGLANGTPNKPWQWRRLGKRCGQRHRLFLPLPDAPTLPQRYFMAQMLIYLAYLATHLMCLVE